MTRGAPILELRGVEKSFGAARALHPIALEIAPGEIVGLVGENGAGKSTLIKILSGVHAPDSGEIVWRGAPARFASPRDALAAGVAAIQQELAGFATLTVAENMLLGERWPRRAWGAVDWRALQVSARAQLAAFDAPLDPRAPYGALSAAQKQEVALARALARDCRLLILDEPTASLSEPEAERLLSRLRQLGERGVAILYVSHRLDEVISLASRIVVLRDGELVGVHESKSIDAPGLAREMVGRPLSQVYPRLRGTGIERGTGVPARDSGAQSFAPILELRSLSRAGMFSEISLSLRPGEIVGLAGLVGAGRSELARAIFGLYPIDGGEMLLRGAPWRPRSPGESLAAGLVYLPEERKRQGLVLDHSVGEAISIGFTEILSRFGLIPARAERERVARAIPSFGIKTRGPAQAVGALSGGNQQKALLARWLDRDPEIIILDEPTRGVDVGAKGDIHALIDRLAARGKAILLISSDLPEVLGMSDRTLVMRSGRIAAELSGAAMTQENVILAASGLASPA